VSCFWDCFCFFLFLFFLFPFFRPFFALQRLFLGCQLPLGAPREAGEEQRGLQICCLNGLVSLFRFFPFFFSFFLFFLSPLCQDVCGRESAGRIGVWSVEAGGVAAVSRGLW
jgi:hypothetical protein